MTDAALRAFSVAWTVACIVTGEACVIPQAAFPVAQVAFNRLEAGMGYDGWHAIADEPTDWAMDVAWEAYRNGGDAEGNLYALSLQDMEMLDFMQSDDCWECVVSGIWGICVGKEWR